MTDTISRAEVLKIIGSKMLASGSRSYSAVMFSGDPNEAMAYAYLTSWLRELQEIIERMPSVGESDERRAAIWEAACLAQQLQDAAFVTLSLDWKQAWLAPMPEEDLSQPPDPIVADPGNLKE